MAYLEKKEKKCTRDRSSFFVQFDLRRLVDLPVDLRVVDFTLHLASSIHPPFLSGRKVARESNLVVRPCRAFIAEENILLHGTETLATTNLTTQCTM